MSWIAAAALTLLIMVIFIEGLRRAGALQAARAWVLGLLIAGPLCLGLYVWNDLSYDCGPGSAPFLDQDLSQEGTASRRSILADMQAGVSADLARCGGSQTRWALFTNLETLILELDQQLATEQIQEIGSVE